MLPWQPVVDGDVIPARPIDRIAAGAGAGIDVLVGTNTDEHRLFLVTEWRDRPGHRRGLGRGWWPPTGSRSKRRWPPIARHIPGASAGDLLAAIQTDWYWRIPAIRLADAHATSRLGHLHVRVRLALTAVRRTPRCVPCARDPFVFDTLGNGTEPLLGSRPAATARGHHARRLGGVCHQWRPRLAEVRSQPQGDHALRYDVGGRGRSSIRGAGAVEGCALGRDPVAGAGCPESVSVTRSRGVTVMLRNTLPDEAARPSGGLETAVTEPWCGGSKAGGSASDGESRLAPADSSGDRHPRRRSVMNGRRISPHGLALVLAAAAACWHINGPRRRWRNVPPSVAGRASRRSRAWSPARLTTRSSRPPSRRAQHSS